MDDLSTHELQQRVFKAALEFFEKVNNPVRVTVAEPDPMDVAWEEEQRGQQLRHWERLEISHERQERELRALEQIADALQHWKERHP